MTFRSPPKPVIPRGETGRTFFSADGALTACWVQLAPPFGVVHVSTCQLAPIWRER